jgi:hypothetical protein
VRQSAAAMTAIKWPLCSDNIVHLAKNTPAVQPDAIRKDVQDWELRAKLVEVVSAAMGLLPSTRSQRTALN